MRATEIETNGKRRSPKNESGFMKPVTGPAIKPKINKSRIDGNLNFHEIH
jgi:hypothetical protein